MKSNHELSKDIIIEKIVYITVAYFWIGTEYRFLSSKSDDKKYDKKESEIWHAKALHICSTFMPSNSPLVKHITKSYLKHHLKEKIERKQEEEVKIFNTNKIQKEIIISGRKTESNKRHLQTPEPEVIWDSLQDSKGDLKEIKRKKNPTIINKIIPKLSPSNSKMDMVKTSKLMFNLDLIPKKKKSW